MKIKERDGSTYLTVNDDLRRTSGLPAIAGFTMMCWFLPRTITAASQAIMTFGSETDYDWYNMYLVATTGEFAMYNGATVYSSGRTAATNRWYHCAVRVTSTSQGGLTGFLDGGRTTWTGDGRGTNTAGRLSVGRNYSGFAADGQYCALKVWNAKLSRQEIQTEMRFVDAVRTANLSILSPLTSARERLDFSGLRNNLLLTGSAVQSARFPPGVEFMSRKHFLFASVPWIPNPVFQLPQPTHETFDVVAY